MSSLAPLTTLLQQTTITDHTSILHAAELTLKPSKTDLNAQHVRVTALLKLDRYADAVTAVESGGDKLKERARLEYAYALYKAGRPEEAARIAREGSERGHRHVEAQAVYRGEDFRRAAELYRGLAAERLEGDAEAEDLRINGGACDAQLEWAGQGDFVRKRKPEREDLEAFMPAYNAACASLARGELAQGEVLLKRARGLCESLEGWSEGEKQAELLPIIVQQVYVLGRLGRSEEAERLAESVDAKAIPDAITRHIAQVNAVAVSSTPANPFLTQRMIAKDQEAFRADAPFHFQNAILQQDRYAMDLQSLKYAGTIQSTSEAISKQPAPSLDAFYNNLSAVNAAAHAKSANGKEALKYILPLLEKRPNDVGLILTIVQLYVLTGNAGSAIDVLETFFKRLEQSGSQEDLAVRFAPGLVGVMVSLYHVQSRRSAIPTELAKAADHWRRKAGDSGIPTGVLHLLKAAGSALLQSPNAEHQQFASEIFADLHATNAEDRYAAAGLLAASPASNASLSSALTPLPTLTSTIDTDALEEAGIAHPTASQSASTTLKRPAPTADSKPQKAKKIRPSRMPKDYDPNKKPDPERWLPLKDRSTYRPPKGKKGKQRANLLSQGAMGPAAGAESDGSSRPATPGGEVVKAKGQGNKKKGKGGKW